MAGKESDGKENAVLRVSVGDEIQVADNGTLWVNISPNVKAVSKEIILGTSTRTGIEIPKDEVERYSRVLDILREKPTTTEWSLGIHIGDLFLGFRQKREFAKISEKEEIEKKQE